MFVLKRVPRHNSATRRGLFPPPCGEGLGVGVVVVALCCATTTTPLPNPPPAQVGYISDLGHSIAPNSGKPEFGWGRERTEPAAPLSPSQMITSVQDKQKE